MNRKLRARCGLAVLILLLVAPPAGAGWTGIGVIQPKSVTVQPGTKVNAGSKVTIQCTWAQVSSMQVHTDWDNAKKLAALNWQLPGEIRLDGQVIKTFSVSVKSSGGQGTVSADWIAAKPGPHGGTCSVDPANIANVTGTKTIDFGVTVTQGVSQPGIVVGGQPVVPSPTLKPGTGPAMPVPPKGLPDITSAQQITIGSTAAQWGTIVTVDAKEALSAQNGICQFAVQHTARNIGLAPTGPFDSLIKSGPAPGSSARTWGSLSPGSQDTQKDMVALKPGMNDVQLAIDHPGKVQEVSETNNQFRVRVSVTGTCGGAADIVPPQGGGQGGLPAGSRVPRSR